MALFSLGWRKHCWRLQSSFPASLTAGCAVTPLSVLASDKARMLSTQKVRGVRKMPQKKTTGKAVAAAIGQSRIAARA